MITRPGVVILGLAHSTAATGNGALIGPRR